MGASPGGHPARYDPSAEAEDNQCRVAGRQKGKCVGDLILAAGRERPGAGVARLMFVAGG